MYWNTSHSVVSRKVGEWREVLFGVYPATGNPPRMCFAGENVILLYLSNN